MTGEDARLLRRFGAAVEAAQVTGPLGLAVSGGGDSMAMLHLAARAGLALRAVTVDHGLRPEAAAEARFVGDVCAGLGVPHDILTWQGWDGRGNLQAAARSARYGLMADWARDGGIGTVALAHTLDDQAETFLMRLGRAAGVDGLAGMPPQRHAYGVAWLRPLLFAERDELRGFLRRGGHGWCEDPSNADARFARVRARQALAALAPLGIDAHVLSEVAGHMAAARHALEVQTTAAALDCARVDRGDVVFDREKLFALPPEITRRLLEHALKWVSSAEFGPRAGSLAEFTAALASGAEATLHGCRALVAGGAIRVTREYQAVRDAVAAPGALWDGRWRVTGPWEQGLELRALGEAGLRACPGWRDTGLPRPSLLASPGVWRGAVLVAAPLAGLGPGWRAEPANGPEGFVQSIISH